MAHMIKFTQYTATNLSKLTATPSPMSEFVRLSGAREV